LLELEKEVTESSPILIVNPHHPSMEEGVKVTSNPVDEGRHLTKALAHAAHMSTEKGQCCNSNEEPSSPKYRVLAASVSISQCF